MILKDHILSLNQLKVCNTHSGVVEGVWSASLSHRQCRGPLRFSLSSSDTWLHSLRVCWASRYRWHRLAWPRSVWVCWSEWVAAKVSGCTCWPSQIDLIKNMGAHLFLWYHERPKWLPWERREEKRRGNQKKSWIDEWAFNLHRNSLVTRLSCSLRGPAWCMRVLWDPVDVTHTHSLLEYFCPSNIDLIPGLN